MATKKKWTLVLRIILMVLIVAIGLPACGLMVYGAIILDWNFIILAIAIMTAIAICAFFWFTFYFYKDSKLFYLFTLLLTVSTTAMIIWLTGFYFTGGPKVIERLSWYLWMPPLLPICFVTAFDKRIQKKLKEMSVKK